MSSVSASSFETIFTASAEVACDGGGGPLGHPRVYLHIDHDTNEVTCPYCSRKYVYKPGEHAAA